MNRKLLAKIVEYLENRGIDDIDIALDLIEIFENENTGQINISNDNSSMNVSQTNKYNITGGTIGRIGDKHND